MSDTKRVFFMRNASSLDGGRKREFYDGLNKIKSMTLPSFLQFQSAIFLCRLEFNSGLSILGESQVDEVLCYFYESNFLSKFSIESIVVSPLLRAKETRKCLFPTSSIIPIELESVSEVTAIEHMSSTLLTNRIQEFEEWIRNCPFTTIFVISHSQFIKRLLNIQGDVHNCDLWSTNFSYCESSSGDIIRNPWRNAELFFRINKVAKSLSSTPAPDTRDNSFDENNSDIFCRICQMTRTEMPDLEMIRPCMCSGSQAYIHLSCLNQWRMTSADAQEACSVCRFRYIVERHKEADRLLHPWASIILSVIIQLFGIIVFGLLIYLITTTLQLDIFGLIFYWLPTDIYNYIRDHQILISKQVGIFRVCYTCSSYLHFRHSPIGYILIPLNLSHHITRQLMNILCSDFVCTLLEILRRGITFISILSGFLYFWTHVEIFARPAMGIYGSIPLISSYISANYSLGMIPGCVVCFKQLVVTMRELTRDVAQRIGERIIEPSFLAADSGSGTQSTIIITGSGSEDYTRQAEELADMR